MLPKMTRFISIFLLLVAFSSVKAQDSLSLNNEKRLYHEIGFNTVLLVKQLISNNPGNTLAQSPYAVFYNLYVRDKAGLRIGLGLLNTTNKTEIEGQPFPRTTKLNNTDFRVGFSYNFLRHDRLTLNGFADYIMQSHKASTVNTSTIQVFPDPVEELTVTTVDKTTGVGAQVGVGVKYNLLKNLSVYAEVPFMFVMGKTTSSVLIEQAGLPDDETTSTSNNTTSTFLIPTTIYLVLRF